MNKSRSLPIYAVLVLLLTSSNLFAQSLFLEAAFPGKATSGYIAPVGTSKSDFAGDSVPDLAFFPADTFIPDDFPVLIIQDGADPNQRWQVPLPSGIIVVLIGFFEINHDPGFKEIALAEKKGQRYINPIVIDVNGAVLFDGSNKELLTIADMDGDNCEEIVVSNPAVPQVEIWGEKKN